MIGTDPSGRVVFWNAAAEQLYGWTSDEAVGRDIVELTPADLSRDEAAEIMKALSHGDVWSGEFLVRGRDGYRFTAHVTDIPVRDAAGALVGIVGISRRMSYLKA